MAALPSITADRLARRRHTCSVPDDAEIRRMLTDAARLVAQPHVSVRVDTELLETVYVEVEDGEVLVHDRGETFLYLVAGGPHSGDTTFMEWSLHTASQAVRDLDVEIVGESTEDEALFRIQAHVGPSASIAAVVASVSQAVDEVFGAHTRADLR